METEILESADGGKGQEKEEVEGSPGMRGCWAPLPFSLPLQVAPLRTIKEIESSFRLREGGPGPLPSQSILKGG